MMLLSAAVSGLSPVPLWLKLAVPALMALVGAWLGWRPEQ